MSKIRDPNLTLFFDIMLTLETIGVPYMVIGAFAAAVYGITRITYDIDIVVDLDDAGIDALAAAYPPPRYYADPYQMRTAVARGILFNIIDSGRGEKADLIPLTTVSRYRIAFGNRVRKSVHLPDGGVFEIWCARPEDVILGKLMAWQEGRSRKHETDVYEMLVFHYLGFDPDLSSGFDEAYIDRYAARIGAEADALWRSIKYNAHAEAERQQS